MHLSHPAIFEDQNEMDKALGILASLLQVGLEDESAARQHLLTYWNYIHNFMEEKMGEKSPADSHPGLPASTVMSGEQRIQAEQWTAQIQRSAGFRRIFRTERGIWGNGPPAMRADDVVVAAYGSTVPLILRPVGDAWQVVGVCYLHEYMQGLAVEEYRRGDLDMQVFDLE
jgi:hypothetical protein